jgi:hypothetical protein
MGARCGLKRIFTNGALSQPFGNVGGPAASRSRHGLPPELRFYAVTRRRTSMLLRVALE